MWRNKQETKAIQKYPHIKKQELRDKKKKKLPDCTLRGYGQLENAP